MGSVDDAAAHVAEAQELLAENGPCDEPLHSILINDDYPELIARINQLEEAIDDILHALPIQTPKRCAYCEAPVGGGLSHKAGCPLAMLEDVKAD